SPLARGDFDLFKSFGKRLVFGMSLPTLRNDLAKVYEPKAPAPSQRLATLHAAKEAGLHVDVALAPTYPECDEADLRATLQALAGQIPRQPIPGRPDAESTQIPETPRTLVASRQRMAEVKYSTACWRKSAADAMQETP